MTFHSVLISLWRPRRSGHPTIAQAADALGARPQTVRQWRSNRIPPKGQAKALADYLRGQGIISDADHAELLSAWMGE